MNINIEVRGVAAKLNKLQRTLKTKVEATQLYKEVERKVKTSNDLKKVTALVQERRKQIEKIAKVLPAEVKMVRNYLESQRKELEKLGNGLVAKVKQAQHAKRTSSKKAAPRRAHKTTTRKAAHKTTTKKAAAHK
jgi:hypothetical protein